FGIPGIARVPSHPREHRGQRDYRPSAPRPARLTRSPLHVLLRSSRRPLLPLLGGRQRAGVIEHLAERPAVPSDLPDAQASPLDTAAVRQTRAPVAGYRANTSRHWWCSVGVVLFMFPMNIGQ